MSHQFGRKKHVELAVTLSLANVAAVIGKASTADGEVPTIPPQNDETPENAENGAAPRDPRSDLRKRRQEAQLGGGERRIESQRKRGEADRPRAAGENCSTTGHSPRPIRLPRTGQPIWGLTANDSPGTPWSQAAALSMDGRCSHTRRTSLCWAAPSPKWRHRRSARSWTTRFGPAAPS